MRLKLTLFNKIMGYKMEAYYQCKRCGAHYDAIPKSRSCSCGECSGAYYSSFEYIRNSDIHAEYNNYCNSTPEDAIMPFSEWKELLGYSDEE